MAAVPAANLALFDFDGTITTRELLPAFVRQAVDPKRLVIGHLLLAPLIIGYKLGWVSGVKVRAAIVRVGFTGESVAMYQHAGLRFAQRVLPVHLRDEAMQRIAWHKDQGDTVVVVSGAFDAYLSHWCREHGLELICSSLEQRDGLLTGRYAGQQCVRAEKARRVRERFDLSAYAQVYAYGDTPEDLDLLALAHRRFYQWRELPAATEPGHD